MRFALNHIAAPALPMEGFFAMARRLGITEVEIRNDHPDATRALPARDLARMAADAGVTVLTINGLSGFNLWSADLGSRARQLADYAAEAGIGALVMCPLNTGARVEHSQMVEALDQLRPILDQRGLRGYLEPLGFGQSSLRRKDEAIAALTEAGGTAHFALLHDTFHHYLSGETVIYPHRTALVHLSGVISEASLAALSDQDRGLIDGRDRLGNLAQIRALIAGGYDGPFSFEPFSPRTHALANIEIALAESIGHLRRGLAEAG